LRIYRKRLRETWFDGASRFPVGMPFARLVAS